MNVYTIESITRMVNSRNGNPRYKVELEGAVDHERFSAFTSSDHAFAYAIGNKGMREGDRVKVEFTKAGRISHMEPAGGKS